MLTISIVPLGYFGVHHGYSNMLPTLTRTIRTAYHFSQLSMLAASKRIIPAVLPRRHRLSGKAGA
jgi:hypothetical protein